MCVRIMVHKSLVVYYTDCSLALRGTAKGRLRRSWWVQSMGSSQIAYLRSVVLDVHVAVHAVHFRVRPMQFLSDYWSRATVAALIASISKTRRTLYLSDVSLLVPLLSPCFTCQIIVGFRSASRYAPFVDFLLLRCLLCVSGGYTCISCVISCIVGSFPSIFCCTLHGYVIFTVPPIWWYELSTS